MILRDLKKALYIRAKSENMDEADLEVRLILTMATGLDSIGQIIHSDRELSIDEIAEAEELLEKRLSGIPMAYLSHRREFFGYDFYVDENVLIPQPDTEILVETSIDVLKDMKAPRVLDMCTGSGCIGTSIRMNVADARVSLSDISPEALEIARRNYEEITGERADARMGNLFEPWHGEKFDFIATNPPYVTTAWYEDVSEEVKNEPKLALLDYAEDGLDIIRRIIRDSKDMLNEGGALIIESDYRQCITIRTIMENNGYRDIRTMKDLAGRERCTIGFLFSE